MTDHKQQSDTIRQEFGKQAPAYAQLTRGVRNIMLDRLSDIVRPTTADEVLDVGCGPGRMALALATLTKHVTGIDITPQMLDQARAQQKQLGVENVRWVEGDILPLPFADGAFSLVFTQATFHHFAEPEAVLREMMRVCAPGGRIVVVDLSFDPAKGLAFDAIETLRDPSHLRVLPAETVRGFGRKAGLNEMEVWSYASPIPAEAVLASSVCAADTLERVRAAYREDAASGADRLGMNLHEENGELRAAYPMTLFAWRRS